MDKLWVIPAACLQYPFKVFSLFPSTKIQSPRLRPGLVERTLLELRLHNALLTYPLVLVCAPAGYGKTCALSGALHRLPKEVAVAWITADRSDDLSRFLACFSAALEPFDLPWRVAPEALAALASQGTGIRHIADEVLSSLDNTAVEHGVIAIDDLHCIDDTNVYKFLVLLLDQLPRHWTVAIASRVDPPLRLSRLRSRSELMEFRQHDLCFSREETCALVSASGALDVQHQSERLFVQTGGWVAGLRLSLSGIDQKTASGVRQGQRYLFDYLASEVLDQMPAELREFLLHCSVLDA